MITYYKQVEGDKITGFLVFKGIPLTHAKFPGETVYDAIFVQVFGSGEDCTVTPGLVTEEALKPNNKFGKSPIEITKPEWLHITSKVTAFLEEAESFDRTPVSTDGTSPLTATVTNDETSESQVN